MKFLARWLLAAGVLVSAGVSAQAQQVQLKGLGASFPAPLYGKWISEYQKMHPGEAIDYQAKGSGAGIKNITDKIVDFGASDAPLNKNELAALGGADNVLQIPTVVGAVVLAYNIPDFNGQLKLDGPTIAEIYLGNIRKWNDPKIVALNPGTSLPEVNIVPVHRVDGSGTNYIFTNYLTEQSDAFGTKVGAGKSVEWPSGQGGEQNQGVTAAIQGSKGAIGYIELTYALENHIPFALVKNEEGEFVEANAQSVSAAAEGALKAMKKGMAVPLWNQPGKQTYPICSFTYLIIRKDLSDLKDARKAEELVNFISWATTEGEKFATELHYAPLTEGVQKKIAEALATVTMDGKPVKPGASAP